jgi:hypothetical protein
MRRILVSSILGVVVMAGVLLYGFGSSGAFAQGQPTPTLNLGSLFPKTPEVTPTPGPGLTPAVEATAAALTLEWIQLEADFAPFQYEDVTAGGPVDMYTANLGDPCAQNTFSARLPVVELHVKADLDYIRIGFRADDGTATAMATWDDGGQTWWCNLDAVLSSELTFEPLVAGDYPIYVGVLGAPRKVSGTLYITAERVP